MIKLPIHSSDEILMPASEDSSWHMILNHLENNVLRMVSNRQLRHVGTVTSRQLRHTDTNIDSQYSSKRWRQIESSEIWTCLL